MGFQLSSYPLLDIVEVLMVLVSEQSSTRDTSHARLSFSRR